MDKIKLIADENISWRVKKVLSNWMILPVNEISRFERLSDKYIWDYAKINNYHILTFDEDFIDLQNLYDYPPKIIWLRIGNVKSQAIAERLLEKEIEIIRFIADENLGVIEIY